MLLYLQISRSCDPVSFASLARWNGPSAEKDLPLPVRTMQDEDAARKALGSLRLEPDDYLIKGNGSRSSKSNKRPARSTYVEMQPMDDGPTRTRRVRGNAGPDYQAAEKESEELKERRRNRRYIYLAIALGIIILLLLIGAWLFAGLYTDSETDEMRHHLDRRINHEIAALNATTYAEFLYLNMTINSLGGIYVGNIGPPSPSLGNPSSVYIQNGTNLIYYKTGPTDWTLVLNATNEAPVCIQDVIPGITFGGPWNSTTVYMNGTIVVYNNYFYISNVNNTNVLPVNNTAVWSVLYNNITGPQGPVGPAGPAGPPGAPMVFSGDWNSTTNYTNGQVVIYNNTLYIDYLPNSNTPPSSNSSAWTMWLTNITGPQGPQGPQGPIGPPGMGLAFNGTWNATTNYTSGDFVIYNNAVYLSITINNYNNTPSANSSVWNPMIVNITGPAGKDGTSGTNGTSILFVGSWSNSTAYGVGDVVLFNMSLYITNTTLGSGGAPPSSGPPWTQIFGAIPGPIGPTGPAGLNGTSVMLLGNWTGSASYQQGTLVFYNGTLYIAMVPNSGVTPPSNGTDWTAVGGSIPGPAGKDGTNGTNGKDGSSSLFEGYWNSTFEYPGSGLVIANNSLFISYIANNNSSPQLTPSVWAVIATNLTGPPGPQGPQGLNCTSSVTTVAYDGNWNATTVYATGNFVVYNYTVYVADMPNIAVPPNSNSTIWNVASNFLVGATGGVGPAGNNGLNGTSLLFVGIWNASQTYQQSNVVLYNNVLYVAYGNTTGNQPDISPVDWQPIENIVGPAGPMGPSGTSPSLQGTWNASITYLQNQIVLYNDSIYITNANSTPGVPPSSGSPWSTILPNIVCQAGPNGTQGAQGSSVGANTMRIAELGSNVVMVNSTISPYILPMIGEYNSGTTDPTLGKRWGYLPILSNQTAGITNVKTEFLWSLQFQGSITANNYLRIDMMGTAVLGGSANFTVCQTGGLIYTQPNATASCGPSLWSVYYRFNYILQPFSGGTNVTCIAAQIGTGEINSNGLFNIGVPVMYTYTTTTIDLTQSYYFQFVAANQIVSDPLNCCVIGGFAACNAQGILATHTNEFVIGAAN